MRAAAFAIVLGAALAAPAAAAAQTPQVIRFDGGAYDRAAAITTDGAGNAYVGGSVEAGSANSFAVVKLGPDGAPRWTARYDGSRGGAFGEARAVAVDSAGNVYAAGFVDDGVIFSPNYDYLVVKFGADGAQRWAQRYDGPGDNTDLVSAIAVDGGGNVYVTGFSYGQGYDWATLKFGPDGTLRWERRLSGAGSSDDRAAAMALLPSGNLAIAGSSQSDGGPASDAETVAYDPQGTIVWRARWSDTATSHEIVFDLDVDASGRIAVTGTTQENPGPYAPPFPVTLRYDSAGNLLQTIREGGSSVDVDAAGNLYVAGTFVIAPSSVAKYDAGGARAWTSPLGADADSLISPLVAADATGAVTVAGTVREAGTGNGDYLTIRFAPDGRELWRYRFGGNADPGHQDEVAGLAIDSAGAALVTGTSWNGYLSNGGTADDIVTLKFAAGSAPALLAPSRLGATGLSRSQIGLTWQDNAGTEDGFSVERCAGIGCTGFTQVAVVGRDVTSYVDDGLARNASYSYRVRAFNAGGVSAYSNTATAKTRRK
jgi:hypothetical protein